MAPQNGNEYLDAASDSDEGDLGYDSEAAEDSRAQRAPKRRKLAVRSEGGDASDASIASEDEVPNHPTKHSRTTSSPDNNTNTPDTAHRPSHQKRSKKPTKTSSTLPPPQKSGHKTGVIYISRIPPYMKPHTLRRLLGPHAPRGLGRIFLTPETASAHLSRTRGGGNKKRLFTDGWLEFHSKRDARAAVEVLNTQIIGGKKGGYYHDDLWNLRYLRGFKWSHLSEQVVNERGERASRLRAEIGQTERENRRFLGEVERARRVEGMVRKRAGKEGRGDGEGGEEEGRKMVIEGTPRHFKQSQVVRKDGNGGQGQVEQPAEVQRVLSKIF